MSSIVAYLLMGLLWLLIAGLLHDTEPMSLLRKDVKEGKLKPSYMWNDFCLDEFKNFRMPVRFIFTVVSMIALYFFAGVMYVASGLIFKSLLYRQDPKD